MILKRKNDVPWFIRKFYPSFSKLYYFYVEAYEKRGQLITKLRKDLSRANRYRKLIDYINKLIESGELIYGIEEVNNEIIIIYKGYDEYEVSAKRLGQAPADTVANIYATYIKDANKVHINDIQIPGGHNKGYGSMVMKYFFKILCKHGIGEITGMITEEDYASHGDRLVHFYKKNGFEVILNGDKTAGRIFKKLV